MVQRSNSFVVSDTLTCKCQDCGAEYNYERYKLGYNTCLECGEMLAQEVRFGWTIVPLPKQGYTKINRREDLHHLNQKTRQCYTNTIKERTNEPTKDNCTKPRVKLYTD